RPGPGVLQGGAGAGRAGGVGGLSTRRPWLSGECTSPRQGAARHRLVRSLRKGALMQSGLARLILMRLAVAIPLLFIISFGVFSLVHLAPGDPVRALLGTRPSDPETLANLRE